MSTFSKNCSMNMWIIFLTFFQPHEGVAKSPDLIRNSYFMDLVKNLGHDLQDFGDVQCPLPENKDDKSARIQHVIQFNKKVSRFRYSNTEKMLDLT